MIVLGVVKVYVTAVDEGDTSVEVSANNFGYGIDVCATELGTGSISFTLVAVLICDFGRRKSFQAVTVGTNS